MKNRQIKVRGCKTPNRCMVHPHTVTYTFSVSLLHISNNLHDCTGNDFSITPGTDSISSPFISSPLPALCITVPSTSLLTLSLFLTPSPSHSLVSILLYCDEVRQSCSITRVMEERRRGGSLREGVNYLKRR